MKKNSKRKSKDDRSFTPKELILAQERYDDLAARKKTHCAMERIPIGDGRYMEVPVGIYSY